MNNFDLSWKNLLIIAGVLLFVIVIFMLYIHGQLVYKDIACSKNIYFVRHGETVLNAQK